MGQFLNRMQIYITPVNGLLFHATVIPDLDLAFFLKGLVNLDENKDLIRFFFFFTLLYENGIIFTLMQAKTLICHFSYFRSNTYNLIFKT